VGLRLRGSWGLLVSRGYLLLLLMCGLFSCWLLLLLLLWSLFGFLGFKLQDLLSSHNLRSIQVEVVVADIRVEKGVIWFILNQKAVLYLFDLIQISF